MASCPVCERNKMFDLEQSIVDWRKQMLAAGIKTPAPLKELEIHLREEIVQQMKSGLGEQQAFNSAVQKIGEAPGLKAEFNKASTPLEIQFIKLAGAACFMVALFFSLWTLPFLFHHETGWLAKISRLAAVAATISGWSYGHKFLPVIRNQFARTVAGFVCWLGCIIWTLLFIINFLPHMMLHPAGQLMATFLWGWTVMAILGGVGHGLEKTVRKNDEQYV